VRAELVTTNERIRAAYVHVPFCKHRCGYCNFTLVAGRDDLMEPFLRAIEIEMSRLGAPQPVETVFCGGGTPTHLPPELLDRLLRTVREWFPLLGDHEFTVEANPADLNTERIDVLARNGVNRISLGAQSLQSAKLEFLDRDHDAPTVAQSIDRIRPHIRSLAVDLIFGAPNESLEDWESDVRETISMGVDHVSTYGLTYERGTALWSRWRKGQVERLDEESERAMFERAMDILGAAGFEHYEVSNFGRPGHRCRHNEVYWSGEEYFAVGPGAARYVNGTRQVNHRSTTTYLQRVLAGNSPVAESEQLSPENRARETLVIGLRRLRGVHRTEFSRQTRFEVEALGGADLKRFLEGDLLRWDGDWLRLTRSGLLVSDSMWPYFLRE
jgi:oxygen-independent coproporphyrinogen-3 oxidase